MVRILLVRGMLVGLLAGVLVFAFGKVVGEPQVDRAIAFESAMDEAKAKTHASMGMQAEEPEPELVSRPVQASYGLLTAVLVYCTAFGGLFALVFAAAYGRIGNFDARSLSALLAVGGFVALYIVPALKYPPNPPAVGEPETIGFRTALYFLMMLISVSAMVVAAAVWRRFAARWGNWSAGLAGAALYVAAVMVAQFMLPDINEVPEGFPAVTLWKFRMASLGMQAVMWAVIGLLFGALTERAASVARQVSAGRLSAASR